MKLVQTTKVATILTFVFFLLLTSCKKEDEIITDALTDEEAVELIESSLQKSTAGLSTEVEEISEISTEQYLSSLECGESYQADFDRNYNGIVVAAAYNVNWMYDLECNQLNIPQSFSFNSASGGTYETQRINSADSSWCNMQVIGLQPTEDQLSFSGSFTREGKQDLTIRDTRTVDSTVEAVFTEIIVDKETNQIQSGDATIVLTGTNNTGQSFSFTGSLVFLGNLTASLTINGETYPIDLN